MFFMSCFIFKVVYLFYKNEGLLIEKNNTSVSQFTVHMPVLISFCCYCNYRLSQVEYCHIVFPLLKATFMPRRLCNSAT